MKRRYTLISISVFLAFITLVITPLVSTHGVNAEEREDLWGKFSSLEEIMEYKEFSEYTEAPELQTLVEQNKLPSVKDRLPQTPFVWKESVMVDGLGDYGGIQRRYTGGVTQGWNHAAGQSAGWCGSFAAKIDGLVRHGPMWLLDSPEPIPNLAKSWEWSEDGKSLTMHLLEGVKWSDGVPFTAEDVEFTYEDNILNPQVPGYTSEDGWIYGDKVTELEVVDKYTLKWHFGEAYPIQVLFNTSTLGSRLGAPVPAHIYKYYHPEYNSEMNYNEYLNAVPADALPAVVVGGWVPVWYKKGQQKAYVRNPYYYQVDSEGKQLPYWDVITWTKAERWADRVPNLLAGSNDYTPLADPRQIPTVLSEAQKSDRIECLESGYLQPTQIQFNFSLHKGIDGERDLALRKMFRKKEFRKAISHLVNREVVTESLFSPGLTEPFYGGLPKDSPYYDSDTVEKYPYNLSKAKEILAELGFRDTDNDGVLNWPENTPIAGEELIIELIGGLDRDTPVKELLVEDFAAAGIDLRVRELSDQMEEQRFANMNFDLMVNSHVYTAAPLGDPQWLGPVGPSTPEWHKSGPGGTRELLSFEREIEGLLSDLTSETSALKRSEIVNKINKLFTENLYAVGVHSMRYFECFATRHKNYPARYPHNLYTFYHNALPLQIRYTPKKDQMSKLTAKYEDLVPTLSDYKSQEWYKETTSWYEKNIHEIKWAGEEQ